MGQKTRVETLSDPRTTLSFRVLHIGNHPPNSWDGSHLCLMSHPAYRWLGELLVVSGLPNCWWSLVCRTAGGLWSAGPLVAAGLPNCWWSLVCRTPGGLWSAEPLFYRGWKLRFTPRNGLPSLPIADTGRRCLRCCESPYQPVRRWR